MGLDARRPLAHAAAVPYQLVGPEPRDEKGRPLAPYDAIGHDHLSWLDRMVRTTAPTDRADDARLARLVRDLEPGRRLAAADAEPERALPRPTRSARSPTCCIGVTQDPAMLVWLNGNQNVKQKPNENYGARDDGAVHARREPRRVHRDRRPRAGPRAHRLEAARSRTSSRSRVRLRRDAARRRLEDDLRPDRQLRPGRTRATLCLEPPAAPVVLRHEALELLRPDAARRGHAARRSQALYAKRLSPAGGRGDPHPPGLLRGAADG